MSNPDWPAWAYGPGGQCKLCNSIADLPGADWTDSPKKARALDALRAQAAAERERLAAEQKAVDEAAAAEAAKAEEEERARRAAEQKAAEEAASAQAAKAAEERRRPSRKPPRRRRKKKPLALSRQAPEAKAEPESA